MAGRARERLARSAAVAAWGAAFALTVAAAPAQPAATTRPAVMDAGSAVAIDQRVAAVVADLRSPLYLTREQASRRLSEFPESALDSLRAAYRSTDDPEVRRRIRQASEPLLLARLGRDGQPGDGFLGIAFNVYTLSGPGGRLERTIVVQSVVPDTPADRQGLQAGDMILAINGDTVADIAVDQDLIRRISAHRPGEVIRIRLSRMGEEREVDVPLASRFEAMPSPQREALLDAAVEEFWLAPAESPP